MHLGSWRLNPLEGNRPLTYLELADELAEYATDLGFTHVELLPVMEHPFAPLVGLPGDRATSRRPRASGRRTTSVPSSTACTSAGVGVILDWVPAHFPRDDWALARFDGTALYEHDDPRRGAHPDWGTLVFNFGRNEVRNFLLANALYWLREYHADGLRVDAVASMLYLDYSRKAGEWVPNAHGGNEDLDAIAFLKRAERGRATAREPGVMMIAEESTAWPGVSRPVDLGGLGFGFKWNMGWMHDTLAYFQRDPIYRRYHHHQLTFSLVYAFSENFILPLSHDEVVHGKGSLLAKMPGDRVAELANLRALYALHVGAPRQEAAVHGRRARAGARVELTSGSLDWHLLERPEHAGVQALVRDLNAHYRAEPALWEVDFDPAGFRWLEPNDAAANVLAFMRCSRDGERPLVCVLQPLAGAAVGLPGRPAERRPWRELLNTDSRALRRLRTSATWAASRPRRSRGTTSRTRPRSRCRRSAPCG